MSKTQKQISVTEAAEIIGCTRSNVLYLIRRGLVKARRIGLLRKAIYAVDAASVKAYAAKPQWTGRPRGK